MDNQSKWKCRFAFVGGDLCRKTSVSWEKNMQNTAVSIRKCAKPSTWYPFQSENDRKHVAKTQRKVPLDIMIYNPTLKDEVKVFLVQNFQLFTVRSILAANHLKLKWTSICILKFYFPAIAFLLFCSSETIGQHITAFFVLWGEFFVL